MSPFDTAHTTSYSTSIAYTAL